MRDSETIDFEMKRASVIVMVFEGSNKHKHTKKNLFPFTHAPVETCDSFRELKGEIFGNGKRQE